MRGSIRTKGWLLLIAITKEEAKTIRQKFPNIRIKPTKNKLFMVDDPTAIKYLRFVPKNKR